MKSQNMKSLKDGSSDYKILEHKHLPLTHSMLSEKT